MSESASISSPAHRASRDSSLPGRAAAPRVDGAGALARRAPVRLPSRARRMLPAPPFGRPASGRTCIRVDVPDRLLRMTRFGLDFAAEPGSGWWRQVEREMQALVDAHLPAGAREVQMSLDIDRLEVVLSYQGSIARGKRPSRCA